MVKQKPGLVDAMRGVFRPSTMFLSAIKPNLYEEQAFYEHKGGSVFVLIEKSLRSLGMKRLCILRGLDVW